jgi:hypothetical protein
MGLDSQFTDLPVGQISRPVRMAFTSEGVLASFLLSRGSGKCPENDRDCTDHRRADFFVFLGRFLAP